MTRRWLNASVSSSILVSSLLLSGCTTPAYYAVHPGALEPSRAKVAPEERVDVWRRAVGALLDQGYVPQVLNEDAFFISARRREDFENDALAKTLVSVYISPDGVLRVEMSGVGYFTSEQEFITAIRERQRLILDLILNRSAGAPKPRS
jgi:hypothetical protein